MGKGLWNGNRRQFLGTAAFGVLPALMFSRCPNNQGTVEDIFRVKSFSCNRLRATNGETLTLNWDYGRPEFLTGQKLRFLRLHLSGIAQEIVDLNIDQRSFEFIYNGPVTVEIQATNTTVSETNPFTPNISAALTVKNLQDLFFKATFRSASESPLFPYLGYPQDNATGELLNESIDVEFTQFVGFFDENNNGSIEPLVNFFPQAEAFRALSITGIESQGFGFREGPRFPFQLFNQPQIGRVNAMIYAGAIAMNGAPLPYKSDDGDGIARTTPSTGQGSLTKPVGFDPIFMALPILEAGQVNLADIQLGNLNQRIVTTVFTNPLQLSQQTLGQINNLTVNRQTAQSTGDIKGAVTGISLSLNNGQQFDARVAISSLSWRTDYIRDSRILDVISTGQ